MYLESETVFLEPRKTFPFFQTPCVTEPRFTSVFAFCWYSFSKTRSYKASTVHFPVLWSKDLFIQHFRILQYLQMWPVNI